jgi:single-stranded DNA-binding protein
MSKEGNAISFAGNLTNDPEVRSTHDGIARAMFRVAVSARKDQEASFFTVIVWRDHLEDIRDDTGYSVPAGVADEIASLVERLR